MSEYTETCVAQQKAIKCDPKIDQPACMSLTYTYKDLQKTKIFAKKCVARKTCQSLCDVMAGDDMENCKVSTSITAINCISF